MREREAIQGTGLKLGRAPLHFRTNHTDRHTRGRMGRGRAATRRQTLFGQQEHLLHIPIAGTLQAQLDNPTIGRLTFEECPVINKLSIGNLLAGGSFIAEGLA